MPTGYEKVKSDNIEEHGKGTRHLEFLVRVYSDRAPFIYELLQNAKETASLKSAIASSKKILIPMTVCQQSRTIRFIEMHLFYLCVFLDTKLPQEGGSQP